MAYTTATTKQVDKSRAVVIFTGDSNEEVIALEMPIGVDKGIWVFQRLAELNAKRTVITSKPVSEGEVITPTAPPDPVLTPQQLYERDLALVLKDAQATAAGLTVSAEAVATHRAAAQASWDAWQSGK